MAIKKRKKGGGKRNPWITFIGIVLVLTVAWALADQEAFFGNAKIVDKVALSEITTLYNQNKLATLEIKGNDLTAVLKESDDKKTAIKGSGDTLSDLGFLSQDVDTEVSYADTSTGDFILSIIGDILPFIIIVVIIVFMMRQFQKNSGGGLPFAKSKAKLFQGKKKTTFDDVAGCKEAKNELEEIVEFLKNPKKFSNLGARIPSGVMLIGSPGTGKTLMAKAVAGEAGVPFFSISGSEFDEMFVGVGASRVRDLFEKAKKSSPAIIFIDEIDAVGKHRRSSEMSGGHEQTLNQILSEMDGFETDTKVIVMAATNRPDVLDKALLRPGRFDRRVVIDKPNLNDREEILQVHSKNKKLSSRISLRKIAQMTAGFAGAELANIMNEAAIQAAKNNQKSISQKDLEFAAEKVIMGPERKSRVLNKKDREITAYHESGHALVSKMLPETEPVHKITIISRGMSLGSTWYVPEEDLFNYSKTKLENKLCTLLGGYVAEQTVFKEITTGSSNDLERASEIARNIVTQYGMSSLGPVVFSNNDNSFLSTGAKKQHNYSEEYARKIDQEVDNFIQKAYKKTENILRKNRKILDAISKELLKKETLNQKDFEKFFK